MGTHLIFESDSLKSFLGMDCVSDAVITPIIILGIVSRPHDVREIITNNNSTVVVYRDLFRLDLAPG